MFRCTSSRMLTGSPRSTEGAGARSMVARWRRARYTLDAARVSARVRAARMSVDTRRSKARQAQGAALCVRAAGISLTARAPCGDLRALAQSSRSPRSVLTLISL
uniref:Uncharacterized protein n=1 Tax=Chrysotila carterae TaxID=13221 RepID=A0A7S4FD76_CHRCT